MQEKDDKALIILPSKSDSTLIILPSKSTKCSLYPKMRRHITRKWSCQSRRACDKKALVHEEIQCDLRTVEMQSTNQNKSTEGILANTKLSGTTFVLKATKTRNHTHTQEKSQETEIADTLHT